MKSFYICGVIHIGTAQVGGQDAGVLCLVLCFGSPVCSSFPEGGSGYVWNTHLHYIVLKVLFPTKTSSLNFIFSSIRGGTRSHWGPAAGLASPSARGVMGTGLQFLPQRKPAQPLLHLAGGGGMGKTPMNSSLGFELKDPKQDRHRDFHHFGSLLFPIWSQVFYFAYQSRLNFPGWAGTFQVFHFLPHTIRQGQLSRLSLPSSWGRVSAMHHLIYHIQ